MKCVFLKESSMPEGDGPKWIQTTVDAYSITFEKVNEAVFKAHIVTDKMVLDLPPHRIIGVYSD